MTVKTKLVNVRDGSGKECKASLLVCPNCEYEKFFCYEPEDVGHPHYQCARCNVSFCQGCPPLPAKEGGEV